MEPPRIREQKGVSGGFRYIYEHRGHRAYGSSPEEAEQNWRRDTRGWPPDAGASAPAPTVALRPTRRQLVVSRSLAGDDARYPALCGPIEGITVNEPFPARGGWYKLQSDGVVTETPIIIGGRAVGRLGDGANHLRAEDGKLYLTIVLDGRLRGVADVVRAVADGYVSFLADWRGQPDRYEFDGGHRVGVLEEWGLEAVHFGSPEYGRGTCRRIYYPAQRA